MEGCTLLLIRHAEMVSAADDPAGLLCGWCDSPLSAEGRLQAARLAERLAQMPPAAALYSSPLRRAADTAHALSDKLRLPVEIVPGLREIHCGILDGRPLSEAQSKYPDLWRRNLAQADEDFRWPGGESYREFRARSLGALKAIAARHPDARVLVVTHAGVISQCLGWLNGMGAARWERFRPRNASLTEVLCGAGGGVVLRFDEAAG